MKINSIISGLAACLLAISITACDKAKDKMDQAKDAAASAADSAKDAAGKAMDATKDAATAAMTNAVATVTGPVGEAITAAQKAISEKNYQGALDSLKSLSTAQLSPEQQKIVDGIKDEAAKMLGAAPAAAAGAVDAAGAALPK